MTHFIIYITEEEYDNAPSTNDPALSSNLNPQSALDHALITIHPVLEPTL